ncbi:MAG: hypothetical protein ABMB14_09745, partial [Myxococcota bacterium]
AEGLAQMRAAVAPEAAAAGLALALATVPGALVARGVGAPTWIVASIVAAVSLFGSDLGPARLTALASLHRDAPPVDPADPAD